MRLLGTIAIAFIALLFLGSANDSAWAQGQQSGAPAAQSAPAKSAGASNGTSAGQYPRSPNGFFRGNGSGISGFYFNLWGLVPVLGLFFLWVHTTQWASHDARGLKINGDLWNSLLVFVGALGFVFLLITPSFFLGFLLLGTAYGMPLGFYIRERNSRVPESAKVMTRRHIQSLIIRGFAMIGINIAPSKAARDSAIGPPIRFLGKSDGKGNDGGRSKQAEKSRGFIAAKELVYDAIMRRATDIHMEPKEEE